MAFITQEDFLARAYNGMKVLLFPVEFANGYFVRGTYDGKKTEYFATIRPEHEAELERILDSQLEKNNNQEE